MLVTQLGASPVPDVNRVKVLHRPHVCQESRNGLVNLSTLRQQSREIAAFFSEKEKESFILGTSHDIPVSRAASSSVDSEGVSWR